MKKRAKFILAAAVALIVCWGAMFLTDMSRCMSLKEPVFVAASGNVDNIGSGTYIGPGYTVEVEKLQTPEFGVHLVCVEMYLFGKIFVGGAIT